MMSAALADDREVLIGTFRVQQAAQDQSAGQRTVEELFAVAMQKLENGKIWAGQRGLETLVARYPRSAEAARARRVLGELYRGAYEDAMAAAGGGEDDVEQADVSPRAGGEQAVSHAPRGEAGDQRPPAADGSSTTVAVPAWRPELARSPRLEDVLRAEAGDRVFFSAGSAEIGLRARIVLDAQARWLSRNPYVFVTIEGHADEPGSDARNVAISQDRAEAVRSRLIMAGVAPARLSVAAKGRSDRIAACDTPLCAAQNRRAVTLLSVEAGSRDDRSSGIVRPHARVPVAAQEAPPPGGLGGLAR